MSGRDRLVDLLCDTWYGLVRRPTRTCLTTIGIVIGVGALVSTLGFTQTASSQISAEFDTLKATQVGLEPSPGLDQTSVFPADTDARLRRLNGVVAAGVKWSEVGGRDVLSVAGNSIAPSGENDVPVVAVSPGYLEAAETTVRSGTLIDPFLARQGAAVVLLGPAVAATLGIASAIGSPTVFVEGHPLQVVGILDDVKRDPSLLASAIVPARTAERTFGSAGALPVALLHVRLGAAQIVGEQAPLAVRADHPRWLEAIVPPDPTTLRHRVESSVSSTLLVLSGISLLIGAVGIMNAVLVSVMERVPEIGLRRALGASKRSILGQFLLEAGAIGGIGGLIGTAVAVLAVVAASTIEEWTPVLDHRVVFLAPLLGAAMGLLGGLQPAIRASAIPPAAALRR